MNYCRECGAEVEGNETWCHECGVRIDQFEDTEGDDGNTLLQRVAVGGIVGTGILILGTAILVIFAALVGTFVLGLGENVETDTSPSDTVTEPDTGLESGDTDSEESSDSDTPDSEMGDSSTEPIMHEMGEAFTVGSGDSAVRYNVEEATTADRIGGQTLGVEADGSFVVVTLEVENTGTEPFIATTEHLKLVSTGGRTYSTATEAELYIEQDSRYDAGSMSFEELQPGLSIRRNLVYDVPNGQPYGLQVEGTSMFSTAEPHYVPLGEVR